MPSLSSTSPLIPSTTTFSERLLGTNPPRKAKNEKFNPLLLATIDFAQSWSSSFHTLLVTMESLFKDNIAWKNYQGMPKTISQQELRRNEYEPKFIHLDQLNLLTYLHILTY